MARVHWLDVLIAPLTWLARARGRRRLGLMMLHGLIFGTIGVLGGREAALWPLPDAPEPFNLAKHGHVDLPDADNAMILYREASGQLIGKDDLYRGAPLKAADDWDWATAGDPPWACLARNGAAVATWLRGADRPDSLLVQPGEFSVLTDLTPLTDLRTVAHLATLEATRRRRAGDLAGAWTYHRGVIRSCLHAARHGAIAPAMIGAHIARKAGLALRGWLDDPAQTPDLLRGAIADLAACRPLASPPAEAIRVEYFILRALLADPAEWSRWGVGDADPTALSTHLPGYVWGRDFLRNEPTRSLRVARLIVAGWLAQVDRPAASRPAVVSPEYRIYAIGAGTPAALRRIRPETLAAWADATACRGAVRESNIGIGFVPTGDPFDTFRLLLAERAYALDHAGQGAPTYEALVPTYLDALPEGVAPTDPVAAP